MNQELIALLNLARNNLWDGVNEEEIEYRPGRDETQTPKTKYVCYAISRAIDEELDSETLVPRELRNLIGDHIGGHGNTMFTYLIDRLEEGGDKLTDVDVQNYRVRMIDSIINILNGGEKDQFFTAV